MCFGSKYQLSISFSTHNNQSRCWNNDQSLFCCWTFTMETEQKFIYKLNCYLSHAKESFSALTRLFVSKLVLKLFTPQHWLFCSLTIKIPISQLSATLYSRLMNNTLFRVWSSWNSSLVFKSYIWFLQVSECEERAGEEDVRAEASGETDAVILYVVHLLIHQKVLNISHRRSRASSCVVLFNLNVKYGLWAVGCVSLRSHTGLNSVGNFSWS